jgi:hypothetical protein
MVKIEKTQELLQILREKYSSSEYAFLTNVGNSTGFKCNRHADAMAMQLWESRGLEIIGFELKVSRSDWLHELKKPSKADPIAKYCDSWYLVLGDANIIQFGELPMGWGLMVPHTTNTLKIVTESKRNLNPHPLDKYFLGALLRRASEQILPEAQLRREYSRGFDEGKKEEKENKIDDFKWKEERLNQLEKIIDDFEKTSGVRLGSWMSPDGSKIGEAVKAVLNGSYLKELDNLKKLKSHAQNCVKYIDEEIQKLENDILPNKSS